MLILYVPAELPRALEVLLSRAFCSVQKEHFFSTIVLFSEKFIVGEITEAKDAKKNWARSRLEHDAAKAKMDSLVKQTQTSKPPSALDLFIGQTHYQLARKKEAQRFEIAMDKVGDTLWKRDFDVLQEAVKCITALHDYVLKSYNTLYQLEEYLKQLRDHARQRRTDFQALREKRLYERRLKEQEEFANRYSPLVELMSAEDLAIVNAVCVTAGSEQEVILESLISILDAHKMTLPIIKQGITNEVSKTSNAGTLFRGNTMATKLMTAWTRMTGRSYLANTLKPLLDQVVANIAQGADFEVDPAKVGGGQVTTNMNNLRDTSAMFLGAVVQSFSQCPLPFRVMANHLRNEVVKSFPEARHTTVGGFIFLRFFCPAILSPDSTSPPLITKVDNNLRRALILISKTLQNLANGLEFGIKEPFMQELNSFIRDNKAYVEGFFDQLAAQVESEEYQPLCSRETAIAKELPALHSKIVQNLEKIAKSLAQYKQEETIPILAVLLAELGEEGITVNPDSLKKSKK